MRTTDYDRSLAFQYLLGNSREEVREAVERRYFEDNSYFEWLSAMEDELIERYARRQLSLWDRRRFRKNFLISRERLERLRLTRALVARVTPGPAVFPVWAMATAGIAVVALGFSLWLWVQNRGLHARLARVHLERQSETPKAPAPLVASFSLQPGVSRDLAVVRTLEIDSAVQAVTLLARVPAPLPNRLRASLQAAGEKEIWRQDLLLRDQQSEIVSLQIPASLLATGDYLLVLGEPKSDSAIDTLETYSFFVSKK